MRRFTIMGFTEAELGFVLAALFVAVAITAIHERDASAASAEDGRNVIAERDSLLQVRDSLTAELEQVRAGARDVSLLRDSIAALEAKISTKVPQCWEKGESRAPIATVDVLGGSRYLMNGDTVGIDDIHERLAAHIARGDSLGCRFIVRARPTAAVNALDQSSAVWRLRQYFDVNDRPR